MIGSSTEVAHVLTSARSAVVMGHTRPDGDSVGSTLALVAALKQLGCDARPVLADDAPPPQLYAFLPGFEGFLGVQDVDFVPDVFVAVDTPHSKRINLGLSLAEAADRVVVIDHHPDAVEWGDAHYIDSRASAVGQLVWRLIPQLGASHDANIATCCYAALVTDTGRFQFQNTDARVLRDAAEMIEAGAEPSWIASNIYQSRTYASFALRARVMERLTVANKGLVAYSWIDDDDMRETLATLDDLEGMPDVVRTVRDIEVAVMLKQESGGTVRGNLRSKGSFDVGAVARALGGGGHAAAAGFTIEGTCAQVIADLLPVLPGGDG